MKKHVLSMAVVMASVLSGMAENLRSAGTLLVDLSADSLTAGDGASITQWVNSGTQGGSFAVPTGSTGAIFTNSLLGKKAVLFSGTAQSVMTNVAAPASLTGTSVWSMEAWVWVAALPAAKSTYLSWTEDNSANTWEASRLMFRYDAGSVAVDNLGTTVGFSYVTPVAGSWHHLAVVRNAFKQEKVFVDGNTVAFSSCADALQSGIPLALGGVKKLSATEYTNFFSGAVSRVRIHTGMLSDQDVLNNFLVETLSYNSAASTVWTGGSGNWNDSAYWSNGVIGASSKAVRILAGAVAVTNNVSPSILSALDIVGATVSFSGLNARIETKTPLVVGRSSGNAGALNLPYGTLAVNSSVGPAVLNLGMDGATSSFSLGGASGVATVNASQVRAFAGAGSAAVQVNSNGVLELDAFVAEASSNAPSITVSGGTLRSKSGYFGLGQFYHVPQVKVSTGGIVFDSVSGSTQSVSAAISHDGAGASKDGGLRKISAGVLVLSGTNSYNGDTSIEAGTLLLASRLTDGLVYRLDASSNALSTIQFADGSNVVSWADANGSGLLFATNKADKCPVYDATLFNGRGGLRFNRDEDVSRRLMASRISRAQSVFVVMNPASNNTLGGLWGLTDGDYGIRLTSTAVQFCGNGNDFASSGWNYINGAAGGNFTVGQPLVLTAISGSAQTWSVAIGSYSQYRRHFRGDLAEVLVYDRKLDDLERQVVESYLMAKWLGTGSAPQFGVAVLPSNTVLSVSSGAAVELGGTSAQFSALKGAGSVGNRNPIRSVLTVGGLDVDSFYTGTITGNVAVTKIGSGSVVLAGPNTYTGLTTIAAGTLKLATGIPSVTGLVYRLDASRTNTITTLADGSNVTVWADAAGSGFTFAQAALTNCPVYDRTLFGGRGGLRFGLGGVRARMVGSAMTNAQTVFAVNMLRYGSHDNGGFWGKNGEDSGLRLGGTSWYYPGNANDFHNAGAGGIVYLNGVISNSTATVGQPHLVTSVSGSPWTNFKPAIGDYWFTPDFPGRYYQGEVAEILVYDRKLTENERQSVEIGLMAKWFPPAGNGAIIPQSTDVSVAAGAMLDIGGGAVTINALSGGGSVSNGALTVTGLVSPKGTLKLPGAPSLTGTLTLGVAANGTCDSLTVSGALNVSGLALTLNLPGTRPSIYSYTLASASGGVTGTFRNVSVTGPWRLIYGPTSIRLVYSAGTWIAIQ